MGEEDQRLIDAWTEYWRTGMSGSCVGGPDLESLITPVWNSFVDSLPQDARVLDMATGNGTVARICAARIRKNFHRIIIDAVDAAEIDPWRHLRNSEGLSQDIQFHAGVRLESLPFEDGQYDGIVSQFGFEYAARDAASAETARVLRPGGYLRLIMHSRDGAIARDIGVRLQRLRAALDDDGVLGIILHLAHAAAHGHQKTIQSHSRKLSHAVSQMLSQTVQAPADDSALYFSREFLQVWQQRERYHPAELHLSLEAGWKTAGNIALRQEQMLKVACSEADLQAIEKQFQAAGLKVDRMAKLNNRSGDAQLAWLLDAHKPGIRAQDPIPSPI